MSVGVKYKPGHRTPKMLLLSPHAAATADLVPRARAPREKVTAMKTVHCTRKPTQHQKDPAQPNQEKSLFHKTVFNVSECVPSHDSYKFHRLCFCIFVYARGMVLISSPVFMKGSSSEEAILIVSF